MDLLAPKDWDGPELPEDWQVRRKVYNQIMDKNIVPMQQSIESPAPTGIPIKYQERRICHLHEQIDRMIGSERVSADLRVEQVLRPYVETPSRSND